MTIRTISENPLVVTVDGAPATVLTHTYVQNQVQREAKYIVAGGTNILIQHMYDFDKTTLPPP